MKKNSLSIKYAFLFALIFLCFNTSNAQPTIFSWNDRHSSYDYISYAKDQKEQGPCGIFATVAAVEAMVQIYFNTTGTELNLSEANLYSACGLDQGHLVAPAALGFFKEHGVIDEITLPFPTEPVNEGDWEYYLPQGECEFETYQKQAKIPAYSSLSIGNDTNLKKAIMDFGPIIVMGTDADQSGDSLGRALHPNGANINHTVLLTGWNSSYWEIKDSWPGEIWHRHLVEIDFFEYDPDFYCIYPVYNDNGLNNINVKDSYGTDLYTQSPAVDIDEDGFFRWGLEAYPPSGFTGCDKMDYDDGDSTIICLDGYNPLDAPYIGKGSKYVCSGGKYFTLKNFSELYALGGFSIQWNVTPSNYFTSNTTGYTTTAFVDPIDSYIGKKCKIEYLLKYNGSTIKTYKFEFIINGPREDLVSTSVLDSYGGSAQGSDDFYYLCPNTNYTIYYNNYDDSCSTANLTWTPLPYGWTENYHYNNYISINTNDYPYGYLQIKANTECCGSNINVKNIYFGEANCGEYFKVYPNPANSFVEIDVIKEKVSKLDHISGEECNLTTIDQSGIILSKVNFKGFPYRLNTDNLPDGLYFLNIKVKDIKSTIRLSVKH